MKWNLDKKKPVTLKHCPLFWYAYREVYPNKCCVIIEGK